VAVGTLITYGGCAIKTAKLFIILVLTEKRCAANQRR